MATTMAAPTSTATITPPRSSDGVHDSWGYPNPPKEDLKTDADATKQELAEDASHGVNGRPPVSSFHSSESTTRKMHSVENLVGGKRDRSVDKNSYYNIEPKTSPSLEDAPWASHLPHPNGDDSKRGIPKPKGPEDENSKWIHRDKLARIESEELQAAGIFVPRTRATSKPPRDRSRSAIRRGTDASEQSHHNPRASEQSHNPRASEQSHNPRSRKNSSTVETRTIEPLVNTWDLRTPEEIAEEEANAYFTPGFKAGSRIPVARISPAPIAMGCIELGSAGATRRLSESPDEDTYSHKKTRSASGSVNISDNGSVNGTISAARRSASDLSPKKNAGARKSSGQGKPGPTGRPKTRSGSTKESNGSISTRPSTRSGELSPGGKAPEGDPPWLVNSYKPDPRLPPDQQLLPTVARRLQQEKWEKEGKFGDVYDKEFRPLNENVFLKPPETEKPSSPEETQPPESEWPLKQEPPKSPRQGSYTTIPKISDKPPQSPLPSIKSPIGVQAPPIKPAAPRAASERRPPEPEDSKGGCGCCVVM